MDWISLQCKHYRPLLLSQISFIDHSKNTKSYRKHTKCYSVIMSTITVINLMKHSLFLVSSFLYENDNQSFLCINQQTRRPHYFALVLLPASSVFERTVSIFSICRPVLFLSWICMLPFAQLQLISSSFEINFQLNL